MTDRTQGGEFSDSLALDVANAFHEAWRAFRYRESNEQPELLEFLERIPKSGQEAELGELLGIEFYHRFRNASPAPAACAEYEQRLPDYAKIVRKTWQTYFGDLETTTKGLRPEAGAGERFERYKILQEIGEGGFGTVYMAQQHEPVRRKVALKVIKPGMDSKNVVARFEAERQALAIMDHPGIAKVFDGGVTHEGRPFFVMELVSGVSITTYCDDNRLSVGERLELFVMVCHAVQHAHQKGIIHRDIKPSNVLVTLHDGTPVTKVIDFGVAKALDRELTEKTMFTALGEFVGTPQYMSPEQAETSGLDIDTRSDVYSLGVLLYELVTGSTPIEKEQLRRAGYAEIQRLVKETESPKPSQRLSTLGAQLTHIATSRQTKPEQLSKAVRGDLDSIILKALEKERGRRYDTATGLAEDVERFLQGDEVLAIPPTTAYRLRKFARRHSSLVSMVAVVAAILLFATAFSVWQAIRADGERTIARTAESKANQMRLKAEAAATSERAARIETRAARDRLKERLYVADMNVVQQSWSEGKVSRVRDLLLRHKPSEGETDLRGFEWYYYSRLVGETAGIPSIPVGDDITTVAAAPARNLLVVATWADVRLYSSDKPYRLIHAFQPHDGVVAKLEVAVSPDGTRLASIAGRELKLWDIEDPVTPRLVGSHSDPDLDFVGVAFSSDGEHFAAGQHGRLTILTSDFGIRRERSLDFDANVLAFSGSTLAIADYDDVRLWVLRDVHGDEDPIVLEGHTAYMTSLSFSRDGQVLASTNHDSTIKLWDPNSGTELATLHGHLGASWSSAFSPAGDVLASIGIDMQVRLWDLTANRQVANYRGHRFEDPGRQVWNQLNLLSYSADGSTLFSAAADKQVQAWSMEQMDRFEVQTADGFGEWTDSIVFAPDGDTFVTRARKKELISWDTSTGAELQRIGGIEENGWDVAFSPDGRTLAIPQSVEEGVMLWDVKNRQRVRTIPGLSGSVSFSPQGTMLAISGPKGVTVLDLASDSVLYSPLGAVRRSGGRLFFVKHAFSPDGRLFAYNSYPDNLIVVTADGGEAVWQGKTGFALGAVTRVAFASDSRHLFLLDRNVVQVWDVETGKLTGTLKHPSLLWEMAVSSDGKTLATASHDGTVALWSLPLQEVVARFPAHQGSAVGVAFAPNGEVLASCGSDGKIRLWRAAPSYEAFVSD